MNFVRSVVLGCVALLLFVDLSNQHTLPPTETHKRKKDEIKEVVTEPNNQTTQTTKYQVDSLRADLEFNSKSEVTDLNKKFDSTNDKLPRLLRKKRHKPIKGIQVKPKHPKGPVHAKKKPKPPKTAPLKCTK